ncbi:bifunctional diguanylate cyclase/phosphodiesterase [Sulfurimonas sp.]
MQTKDNLFNVFLENTKDLLFVLEIDEDDTFIAYANATAKNRLGYTIEEMNDLTINGFRRSLNELKSFEEHIQKLQENGDMTDYAILICKDKTEFPVEVNAKIVQFGDITYNVAIVRDITQRLEYESKLKGYIKNINFELTNNLHKLQSYKSAMDVNSIVTISDPKGIIKYANDKFYEISGYTKDEVISKNHNIVRHPDTPKETFKDMWETISEKKVWRGKLKNLAKDGTTYIVQIAIVPILDNNGDICEYIATRYEITDIVNKQNKIESLLKTDTLTGLYNRFHLNEIIGSADENTSIALIDINGFHEINDFYGESVGDSVIVALSRIIKNRLSSKYSLFHLSGDEFIVFNKDVQKELFINEMIETNNFLNTKTLKVDEKTFYLNTTMSLSFDTNNLLSSVHMAKTFAKQNALTFNIYTEDNPLEKEYKSNLIWSTRIKKAIQNDKITVFFQPIVDTKTKETIRYEALVRMVSEEGEVISPYFFLDKAKKSNQYTKITKIVIEKSIKAVSKKDISCSINLTIEDILSQDVKEFIFDKLDNCKKCENITFELVESEGIDNFDEVNEFIKTIKSYGCKLAIDDFGTGYSNFEYLLKLNADVIKIDGSLIKEIDKNQDHYDIVKTIVSFAKIKNLGVVAEFVSSPEIHEKIIDLDIDYSQGYLFSEPKPL